MLRETLRDGSVRLVAEGATFVIRRMRPGAVLLRAQGTDWGQFGANIAAELSAEFERFPRSTDLYIDAFEVQSVSLDVRAAWTAWMIENRTNVRAVHMLARQRSMQLVLEIAGHHARTPLHSYTKPSSFWSALRETTGDVPRSHPDPGLEPVRVSRKGLRFGAKLDDGSCNYEFLSLSKAVLLFRVVGLDTGILASAAFDELATWLRDSPPLHLFIDLSRAQMPTLALTELWTEWFSAHRARLASVTILSTDPKVSLAAHIATWRSRTGDLIAHLSNPERFDAALARPARGFVHVS